MGKIHQQRLLWAKKGFKKVNRAGKVPGKVTVVDITSSKHEAIHPITLYLNIKVFLNKLSKFNICKLLYRPKKPE